MIRNKTELLGEDIKKSIEDLLKKNKFGWIIIVILVAVVAILNGIFYGNEFIACINIVCFIAVPVKIGFIIVGNNTLKNNLKTLPKKITYTYVFHDDKIELNMASEQNRRNFVLEYSSIIRAHEQDGILVLRTKERMSFSLDLKGFNNEDEKSIVLTRIQSYLLNAKK